MGETIDVLTERIQADRRDVEAKLIAVLGDAMTREARTLLWRYGTLSRELGEAWLVARIMSDNGVTRR
jgi:hypothetical protein